jgi:hypothetical protein
MAHCGRKFTTIHSQIPKVIAVWISAVTKDGRVLTLIPRTLAAAAFLNVLNPKKSQQIL